MDVIERAAIAAEGYDPDDPAVVAALARVRAMLAEPRRREPGESCADPSDSVHRLGRMAEVGDKIVRCLGDA
jgi:hypothetical protein